MGAHATLSPSSAARWMHCAGSVAATVDLPQEESSFYAKEGTAAHHLAELALLYERDAAFWKGESIEVEGDAFVVDDEMASFVQQFVDQVRRQPGEIIVEGKLDVSPIYGVEDQFGTGDACVLDYENAHLYFSDLKYGRGEQVFVDGNPQLYSYAAAALHLYDPLCDWKTITVAVHQPRLGHYDEKTLTREELEAWIPTAQTAAQLAYSLIGQPAEVIEKHKAASEKACLWCPIKATCRVATNWAHEQVFDDFEDISEQQGNSVVRDVIELSPEELGRVLEKADTIGKWLNAVRAEGVRRVAGGIHVPGWKLVQGKRGARKWTDEELAEAEMEKARVKKADRYKMTLLSPTQAEKLFKGKPKVWARLQEHITQPEGKPALAPASDSRPSLENEAEQFKDISGDDFSDILG